MNRIHSLETAGMTLIELMLYLAIASVLVVVLTSASIDQLRAADRSEQQHAINRDVQRIAVLLERTALRSSAIDSPEAGASASTTTFSMYDTASDPTQIYLENDVLWLKEGERAAVPLHATGTIADVSFTRIDQGTGVDALHASITLSAASDTSFGAKRTGSLTIGITTPN